MHDLNDCFTLKLIDKNCSNPTYSAVVINLFKLTIIFGSCRQTSLEQPLLGNRNLWTSRSFVLFFCITEKLNFKLQLSTPVKILLCLRCIDYLRPGKAICKERLLTIGSFGMLHLHRSPIYWMPVRSTVVRDVTAKEQSDNGQSKAIQSSSTSPLFT